jgi:hypothetical protein
MRTTIRMTGILFALTAISAMPAQAQLGGFIKRAAKKAAEGKVDEKVEEATPVAPMAGDPVTGPTLDALMQGLSLELETSAKTKQLWTAIQAKGKEVTEAERAAGNEPDVWHKASRDVERCVSSSLEKSDKLHEQEMPQKMMALSSSGNNSPVIARLEAIGKRMRDAQAKNDMPAYMRAMTDYAKILGFDAAKDSAVAFGVCGKLPTKPASMVKLEQLQAEVGRLSDERRDLENETDARAAKAAGMPADKYALARERLWAWSDARKQKKAPRVLTKDEDALFTARASEIKRVESMLR